MLHRRHRNELPQRDALEVHGEVHGECPVLDELADLTENPGPAPEPGRAIT